MGRGEPDVEEEFVDARRAKPRRRRRSHRLRRRSGAGDFRGERFRPDAVALRALRPEPDVCAALRRAADRASHRRPRRDDRGRQDRLSVRRAARAEDSSRAIHLAFETYGSTKRIGDMRRAAMALKFDWSASAQALFEPLSADRGGRGRFKGGSALGGRADRHRERSDATQRSADENAGDSV